MEAGQANGDRESERFRIANRIGDMLSHRQEIGSKKIDLVYERYSLWSSRALEFAKSLSIPSILEVNAPLIDEQREHRSLLNVDLAMETSRRAMNAAQSIVAVSSEVADYVERTFPETSGRIHVVPNGVDVDRFSPVAERGADGSFVIGFVGSLKPWHGIESLLEAFALVLRALPHARLCVVGDGPMRESLELAAETMGISEKVEWTGAILAEQVPEMVRRFDVAVAPYMNQSKFYFSPLKVFEYMACGCAVVASDVGQLRVLIDDGQNGMLFEPGNCEAMAYQILKLAYHPELRGRIAARARQTQSNDTRGLGRSSRSWRSRRVIDVICIARRLWERVYDRQEAEEAIGGRRFRSRALANPSAYRAGSHQATMATRVGLYGIVGWGYLANC